MLAGGAVRAQAPADLLDLSIEELGELRVTSVSRREERLSDAAAAVYVLTREDILRSGARSLPEALRLAPGIEVARNGAHQWTISMRGFNNDLSNKLLVLIDGRSVYSPLYAGVFWDAQHVFLEDIERIEVIAGPGGTMWGANAVNGVINVITRSAWDTEGGVTELGVGDEHQGYAGLRYAGRFGNDVAVRGYAQVSEWDAAKTQAAAGGHDDWDAAQAGFRLDWDISRLGGLTVQGDIYEAEQRALLRGDFTLGMLPEEGIPGRIDVSGYHLLTRWQRTLDRRGSLSLQAYYDHTDRAIPNTFDESRDTFDVDFQHRLGAVGRHDLIWGAGLRVTEDRVRGSTFSTFTPRSRRDRTYSLFLQDEIDLYDERVFLTLGTKLENNDYTGNEHQPNVRLSWHVTDRQTLWAAVSRAVRVPARLNEDLELHAPLSVPDLPFPVYVNVSGNDAFESEKLIARELGYRVSVRSNLSFDVALYEHAYDRLQTTELVGEPFVVEGPPQYLVLPFVQANGLRGDVRGATLSAQWEPIPRWRLHFQYSQIDFDLGLRPGSSDDNALNVAGYSPETQAAVYSYWSLPRGISVYAGVRYVDDLPALDVPSYTAADVSVRWQASERTSLSLTVQNLNDDRHLEFGGGILIERSAFLLFGWTF